MKLVYFVMKFREYADMNCQICPKCFGDRWNNFGHETVDSTTRSFSKIASDRKRDNQIQINCVNLKLLSKFIIMYDSGFQNWL